MLSQQIQHEASGAGAIVQPAAVSGTSGDQACRQCGGSSAGQPSTCSSHASATGKPSSYARVHGAPSRAPAQWRRIDVVAKERLEEVKYEKAVGEGIAKVRAG